MKIIDVPIFNEDGSIKFTQVVGPEEAQMLLQFAINFLVSTGMSVRVLMADKDKDSDELQIPLELND